MYKRQLISIDYDPASAPEVQPMLLAVLRHLFKKQLVPVVMALWPLGPPLGQEALTQIAKEFNKIRKEQGLPPLEYGKDYVMLDYRPGGPSVILSIGREFRDAYSSDFRGIPLDELPVMRNIHNYRDFGAVVGLEAGATGDAWAQAQPRFGFKLILGGTAVTTPDWYPYLNSGQIRGLIGGLKGASEYEQLVLHPDVASFGMAAQSVVHLLIILFIILGNIGYFVLQRGKK